MKRSVPAATVIGVILFAVGLIGIGIYAVLSPKQDGPDPKEVAKHAGRAAIEQAIKQGPPDGPPIPGGDRNPMLRNQ